MLENKLKKVFGLLGVLGFENSEKSIVISFNNGYWIVETKEALFSLQDKHRRVPLPCDFTTLCSEGDSLEKAISNFEKRLDNFLVWESFIYR